MKIGIKATQIVEGGGQKHLERILEHYPRNDDTQIVIFLSDRQRGLTLPDRDDIQYRYFESPSIGLVRRVFWEQFTLRRHLKKEGIDILFEPGNFGMISNGLKRVMLIHNLAPFSRKFIAGEPAVSKLRLHLLRLMTRMSARRASGVIHLTEFARSYVSDDLRIGLVHQSTVYMGIDKGNRRKPDRAKLAKRFNIVGKLIFSCSHIYRYKNVLELVQAFKLLRDKMNEPVTLVIAGNDYDKRYTEEINAFIRVNRLGNQVRLVGALDYDTLLDLYAACDLFAFPSELESASLILLEALQSGAPIAASDTDLCCEVLAGAGAYFDPKDARSICDVMKTVLRDKVARANMRKASRERAAFFSWKKTAFETDKFIRKLADQNGHASRATVFDIMKQQQSSKDQSKGEHETTNVNQVHSGR